MVLASGALVLLIGIGIWPELATRLFDATTYQPHGMCFYWQPDLLWLHIVTDTAVGLAYMVISVGLLYLWWTEREHLHHTGMVIAFGAFIFFCGLTHFMSVITLYVPVHWFSGIVKLITALASVVTAVALPATIPAVRSVLRTRERTDRRALEIATAHAQLDQAYLESQTRYRLIADHARDLIVLLDADGRYLYASPSHQETIGTAPEQLIGTPWIDQVHESDLAPIVGAFFANLPHSSTPDTPIECRMRRGASGWVWIELRATPVWIGTEHGLVIVGRDSSERHLFLRQIADSEARFRLLIERSADVIMLLTEQGTVLYGSPALYRVLGYEVAQLIGQDINVLIAPKDQALFQTRLADSVENPDLHLPITVSVQSASGDHLHLEGELTNLIRLDHVHAIVWNCRDVTDQVTAEQRRRESEQRYRQLVENSPEAILVHAAGVIVYANPAALRLYDAHAPDQLLGQHALALVHPDFRSIVESRWARIASGEIVQMAEEQLLRLDGMVRDVEVTAIPFTYFGWPAIQVVIHDVTDRKAAAQALANAYEDTLEGWARALDLRDRETEGHSRRVTAWTVRLARQLGINDSVRLAYIRWGALLHDLGKIGVPDAVLHKPGPLTPEEMAVMRQHVERGVSLIEPIPFLRNAMPIPQQHHERWDGKGYPRGLAGEQIAFEARIFAVIDTWDAMTNDRVYRKAMSTAEALERLEEVAGTQLDPYIVQTFAQLIRTPEAF
jgi:PAS domain S-box-containing protein/putative nucleotidyltransferase with HDIG domain